MGKKKKTAKKTAKRSPKKPQPEVAATPEVQEAAEAVCQAKAELEKAQGMYQKVRNETTDQLKAIRGKTVGELVDDTLEAVKKHPGPGVIVAGLIGVFLARLFGR